MGLWWGGGGWGFGRALVGWRWAGLKGSAVVVGGYADV